MKAKLKSIMSSDCDMKNFSPSHGDSFNLYVQAEIGPDNDNGSNIFGFNICNTKWIDENLESAIFGKGLIIVNNYNFEKIKEKIENLCSKIQEDTWNDLAIRISRYGQWEYEDYKY